MFQSASAAEIFIGWSDVVITPKRLPSPRLRNENGTSTTSESAAARRKTATLRPRTKCQQAMPNTTIAPIVSDANSVCTSAYRANLFPSSAPTLVRCAAPELTL